RGFIHGDLKPENVLITPAGRVRIVDFGLARAVGSSGSGAGTVDYMAPEQWRTDVAVTSAADIWSLGVMLHELLIGRRPFAADAITRAAWERTPLSFTLADGSSVMDLISACLSWDAGARPSARAVAAELDRSIRGRLIDECPPFRGLVPFSEADAADYWGREEDASFAVEHLRKGAVLAIVGPSGIGKSSFALARLVPRLRESYSCSLVHFRPSDRPVDALAASLSDPAAARDEAAKLRLSPERIRLLVAAHRRAARCDQVILLIDQLEEAITLADADEATPFFSALRALAREKDAAWKLILVVRDDFLGRLYQTQLGDSVSSTLALRPLGVTDLEAAIRGPVERCAYAFDPPDLPKRIAADVVGQPAALPLLQFACQAIWERRDSHTECVTGVAYDDLGGAAGALVREAEHLLASLSASDRDNARDLLLSLVRPDGTRVPVPRRDLPARHQELTERFIARRLLAVRGSGEGSVVELAHESLTELWPELKRWLAEFSDIIRVMHDVEEASQMWERRGRPATETWRGDALRAALSRLRGTRLTMSPLAQEFLAASQAEQRRSLRLRRSVLGGFFVLATAFATTATWFALRSRADERRALSQQRQLRTAAENLGDVELRFAAFDWDETMFAVRALSPAAVPHLSWRLWRASSTNPDEPQLDAPLAVQRLRRTVGDREVVDAFEAPGGAAFLEISGRGATTACASSWVRLRAMPGYLDKRAGRALAMRIPVPTCDASRAGMVMIPAGPFTPPPAVDVAPHSLPAFAIDRNEATNAQFAPFAEVLAFTGYERMRTHDDVLLNNGSEPAYPVTGIDVATAQAFCHFLGKRLPTRAEWIKAFVGPVGAARPRIDARTVAGNFLGDRDGAAGLAPAAQFTRDVTPYGVFGMMGNAREWTSTIDPHDPLKRLYYTMGGDWDMPAALVEHYAFTNLLHARFLDFAQGARCVVDVR
ncbi:MAG TPA: SUMF1/EgtB/PvdO family nonheme iron enzyme, partial [Polyangia bacterium]